MSKKTMNKSGASKAVSRRDYLKKTAAGVAGAGAATLAMPTIAKA